MDNPVKGNNRLIIIGYFALGTLIGYICGITSSEIAKTITTSLFALIGWKILNDLVKKRPEHLNLIGSLLIAFCFSFFIGLNSGIFVKVQYYKSENKFQEERSSVNKDSLSLHIEALLRADLVKRDMLTKYNKNEISKDSIVKLYFNFK